MYWKVRRKTEAILQFLFKERHTHVGPLDWQSDVRGGDLRAGVQLRLQRGPVLWPLDEIPLQCLFRPFTG